MSKFSYGEGCLAAIFAMFMGIGIWVLFTLVFAWPIQLLWNWLIPELFNGPTLTFWQAAGLELLSCLLIKGNSTTTSSK